MVPALNQPNAEPGRLNPGRKEKKMTEITIKISGREARQILEGLLQMSYDHGKRAEAEELKAMEYQFDENENGECIARARARRERDAEAAANTAYDKFKAEAMRLGLII
jgi:hypothetical protein